MKQTDKTVTTIVILLLFLIAAAFGTWYFTSLKDEADRLKISEARAMPVKKPKGSLMVTLNIANAGDPATIENVVSNEAKIAHFMGDGEPGFTVPGNGSVSLAGDGTHIMLMGILGELERGRLIPITLTTGDGSTLTTKALIAEPKMDGHAMHGSMGGMKIKPAPEISLSIIQDQTTGIWSISANVENFKFDTTLVDQKHVPGAGHGHLYLNGLKLGRYFGGEYKIGTLPTGNHKLNLILNTNVHMPYMVNGSPVSKTETIVVE